jgi:hypothetical protein
MTRVTLFMNLTFFCLVFVMRLLLCKRRVVGNVVLTLFTVLISHGLSALIMHSCRVTGQQHVRGAQHVTWPST